MKNIKRFMAVLFLGISLSGFCMAQDNGGNGDDDSNVYVGVVSSINAKESFFLIRSAGKVERKIMFSDNTEFEVETGQGEGYAATGKDLRMGDWVRVEVEDYDSKDVTLLAVDVEIYRE